MRCPSCRAENRAGRRFCAGCGAALGAACPSCGFANAPGERFCGGCGATLPAAAAPAERPPVPGPGGAAGRPSLEDERKHVTVLFADTKASMELLAHRDPEDARRLLDPLLELMMEAVHHYGGTVNQVMGDGIMALFGAPVAQEDHALRACYAALRIQESARRRARAADSPGGPQVDLRVGLHSGEVVVRTIRGDLHPDYTAIGQTTHLAARMEQMARPGTALITADVVRLTEGYVDVVPLGPVDVRGIGGPVEVFELTGARAVRSPFADRELTPLIGRDAALAQLHAALERAAAGRGQVVSVIGEPGVGKSRLSWEFTRSAHAAGWRLLESAGVSYGQATAYLPVVGLLTALFHIEPGDDPGRLREAVGARLAALGVDAEPALSTVLSLIDPSGDPARWPARDPAERRRHTLDVLARLLVAQSRRAPLLVAVENLQWIDFETQAVLDVLVEALARERILLLVNHRPEYRAGWSGRPHHVEVRLDPLTPAGTAALVRALGGDDPSLEPLARHLAARTGGNPLFVEETIRTLAETGVLEGHRGALRLTADAGAVKLPVTVQAVLAARIDRLAAEHKRILQSAAVIGARVPFQLLHAITGLGEEPLRAGLRQLAAAAFLREQRLFPDVEYAFTQALTHEVAYRSLLQARRRELHARIVEVIEGRAGEGLLEHAEILAHHAARAELWSKAVAYARQAGAKAAARSATREAVAALDQALAALARLPESRETIELGIDVRFELQSALIPVDDLARMLDCLREAEQLAEAIGDQRRLGRVWAHMSYCCTWKGESVRAVEHGERALALAAATADRDLELLAQFHLGRALFAVGDLRRAIGAFAATAAALTGERLHERLGMPAFPAVTARSLTALCRASLGEFPAARQAAIEGLRLAQAAEHPFSLAVAQWGLGLVHLLGGEAPDAVTWLGHSVELCRARGFTNLALLAGAPLAHACALTGKIADALALLAEMAPPPGSVNTASRAANVARAAEVYLRAGRAAEAAAAARRALELSRAHGQQAGVANALRVLGDVHAASAVPDVGAAETAYREARDLGERLGLRPLIAHCHRGLGLLHLRCGDRARADEHLGAAAALYRELGMRAWLEPPLPTATNPRP